MTTSSYLNVKQHTLWLSTKKIQSAQCTLNERKPEQIEQADLTSKSNSSLNAQSR
jgi:hypothetical protein